MLAIRAIEAVRTLRDEESGQGLVEYGLILGLIAVIAIGALTAIGTGVDTKLTEVATALGQAVGG